MKKKIRESVESRLNQNVCIGGNYLLKKSIK